MNPWIKNALGIVAMAAIAAVAYYACYALQNVGEAGESLTATAASVNDLASTLNETAMDADQVVRAAPATLTQANLAIGQLGPVLTSISATTDRLNGTLDIVNRPCASKDAAGMLLPDGTLCTLDKTVVKIGDIVVTSQKQEKDVADAAQSNMAAVSQVAADIHGRLTDPRVDQMMTSLEKTTASGAVIADQGAGIATDLHKEADNLVKPQPVWKALIPGAELAAKLWACAFQHVCVN